MKRLLLASTMLAFGGPILGDQALAAPPVVSWTGCYIGANAGTGWSRNNVSDPTGANFALAGQSFDVSKAGFLGGAQLGCNYQAAPHWVVGLQGDFTWSSLSAQGDDPFFGGKNGGFPTATVKTTSIASAQGRVGYAWDNIMVFGTGGPAWAHNKYNMDNLVFFGGNNCQSGSFIACTPSGSDTRPGWTLGIGFEWAFINNWSAGLIYNHYDFGSRSITLPEPNGAAGPTSGPIEVKQQIDTVKLSLNYRFGWLSR